MLCRTCKTNSSRIVVISGIDTCTNCGLIETAGSKVDGSVTRNSFRVREQQQQYKADLTPAWSYDKHSKKVKPNTEFIKQFPDQAEKTFTNKELKDVGITKLKGKS